jgi:hypothetical protein
MIFLSCKKNIDLPIKNATPRIVIEATISDLNEPQIVYISQTVPFQTDTKKVPLTSAVVSVKEDGGSTLTFVETKPGVYQSSGKASFRKKRQGITKHIK